MIEENIESNLRDTGLGEDFLDGTPLTKPLRLDHTHMHIKMHTYISKKVKSLGLTKVPTSTLTTTTTTTTNPSNRQASMSNLLSTVGNGSSGDSSNNVVSM